MSKLKSPVVAGLLVTVVLSALVATYSLGWHLPILADTLEAIELETLDWRFAIRGPQKPDPRVVILAFDDFAMEQDPSLFEKRAGWAKVLSSLKNSGVKAIGIDALFVDPERILDADLQADLDSFFAQVSTPYAPTCTKPMDLLIRVYDETQGDLRLEAAIRNLGNVVLACHLGNSGKTDPGMGISKASFGQSLPGVIRPPAANTAITSMPGFNAAALSLGVITVGEDSSHSVRHMVAVRCFRESYLAAMAIQVVAAFQDIPRASLAYIGQGSEGRPEIHLGTQVIKLDPHNAFGLNYRGGPGTFPTYSVKNLVEGKIPPESLRGKIVLVGFTYFGHDRARTPFSGDMPGVEVHATAVDNILNADPIRRTPWWLDALLCAVFGFLLVALYWRRFNFSPMFKTGLSLVLLLGYLILGMALFSYKQIWINWSGPLALFVLLNMICLTLSYVGEELARRRVRIAFSHYLSNDVIEQLLATPESLKLGGERLELTVLFSDIRGFTSLSEGMDPKALSDLLNEYLTPMTRIVLKHRGLLDKYIGDAIMAVFGAPVPYPEHPQEACLTALEMIEELQILNQGWKTKGIPSLDIGIGINTGTMSVGNMGSEDRFDYTVIGDNVNLASRLEGLNKLFGTQIIISQSTRRAIGDSFTCRELDLVAVKGKNEPVTLFELVHSGSLNQENDSWIDMFETALSLYRKADFAAAAEKFRKLASEREDGPCEVFINRCEAMLQSPPKKWDGVFRAKEK